MKAGAKDGFISKELRRHRNIRMATPKWANIDKICELYLKRDSMNQAGFNVVVDHIVPINHNYVCGLHCESNLEIISYRINEAKSNHYWPDMPNENLDMFGVLEVEQYELNLE